MTDNKEDFESQNAQIFKGAHETYHLTSKAYKTTLDIAVDMSDDMFDMMSKAWDEALLKIKSLAEA